MRFVPVVLCLILPIWAQAQDRWQQVAPKGNNTTMPVIESNQGPGPYIPRGNYKSMPSLENGQAPGPYNYSKGEGTPDPHFFQSAPHQMMYRRDPTYHGDYYSQQYKRDIFRQPSKRSRLNFRPRSEKRHYPKQSPNNGFPNYPTTSTPSSRL